MRRLSFTSLSPSSTSSSSYIKTQTRTVVFTTYASKVLDEVAKNRGFSSPFWMDRDAFFRLAQRYQLSPRPGEGPTNASISRQVAIFNIDQLRATPKAMQFLKALPKIVGTADDGEIEPTDAQNMQPFRGPIGQQLKSVAFKHKWGRYWLPATKLKNLGFLHVLNNQYEPAAWQQDVQVWALYNFDQIDTGASGIDFSTVPINFRYGSPMLGSETGEILRNEALRRGVKYPVVTTNKLLGMAGCSILPEKIDGFHVPHNNNPDNNTNGSSWYGNGNNGYYNNNNRYNNGYHHPQQQSMTKNLHASYKILYNLDEFDVEGGAQTILKSLDVKPDVIEASKKTPTFLMTEKPITKQLILNDDDKKKNTQDDVEQLASSSSSEDSKNVNNDGEKDDNGDDDLSKKFSTGFWIRDFEAAQLSQGQWKLKPNAKGATLGGGSIQSKLRQEELKKSSAADGSGDLTSRNSDFSYNNKNDQNNSTSPSTSYQQYQENKGKFMTPTSPYYFDTDIKERKEFLSAVGKYVI